MINVFRFPQQLSPHTSFIYLDNIFLIAFTIILTLCLLCLINIIWMSKALRFLDFWKTLEILKVLKTFEIIKSLESSKGICLLVIDVYCHLILFVKWLATNCFFVFWYYLTTTILLINCMVEANEAFGAFEINKLLLRIDI